MEKTLIDRVISGEIHTLELIERLRTYSKETIEKFIVELDLESVIRNDGTIEGKRIADYIQNVINTISKELKVPDQWTIYERGNGQAAQEPRQQSLPVPEAIKRADATLRAIKNELEKFGLINNGCWAGSPSEFGELVRHLKEDCGVENRGGHAWEYCRLYFGYQGSIKSAQNSITSNQGNITSDAAAVIRRICKKYKSNIKNRDL